MLDIFFPFLSLIRLFLGVWDTLSPERKEKIISVMADAFEELFREYYRRWKG